MVTTKKRVASPATVHLRVGGGARASRPLWSSHLAEGAGRKTSPQSLSTPSGRDALGPVCAAAANLWRHWPAAVVLLLVTVLLSACQPPGPRALLKGEQLIRKGRYAQAVEELQQATRLLPQAAQAWNHLGLAYHGNRQPQEAFRAYQKALSLDYKLAAAHFNLGCLYLEQNNLPAAVSELNTFTLLEPDSLDGWLRLASAQLRAGRLDPAEKAYRAALDLRPRHPEALSGLGVVKYQRRRNQEALDLFNAALAQNPGYGPALLNAAVVLQQTLNNRAAALQRYRQYLALSPRPTNWETVEATARQLESELNLTLTSLPPARAVVSNVAARPVSNPPAASVSAAPPHRVASNRVATPPAATNRTAPPLLAIAPGPRTDPIAPTPSPKSAVAPNLTITTPAPVLIRPGTSVIVLPPAALAPPTEVEVTRLQEEPEIKPPQEILAQLEPANLPPNPPITTGPVELSDTNAKPKRNFFDRINPFRPRTKTAPADSGITPVPDAAPEIASHTSLPPAAPPTPLAAARYAYTAPAKPAPGDRAAALRLLAQGFEDHQAGKLARSNARYKEAVQADPSCFEAHFNQGLAAYELGRWQESLAAYELALALKPDSEDARYNLALALKRANYPLDAAHELETLLEQHPKEARAHYSLAVLYAQQLDQPDRAKSHYRQVLELDPRHPEASTIRYWLAQHP